MQRITMMEAYGIETLKNNGYSNEEITEKVRNNEIEEFKSVDKNMDYSTLIELNESNFLGNILKEGYQVKFLTINGLTNLIRMKYKKEPDEDYKLERFVLSELQLDEESSEELENLLSSNWRFSETKNGISISPSQ